MEDDLVTLPLYITNAHPCSYLAEQEAKTVFIEPELTVSKTLYSNLAGQGFRRSGFFFYQPQCSSCEACVSVRVVVNQFDINSQQKRIIKRNSDLQCRQVQPSATQEYYQLYERYINQRHVDGDMYPPNFKQFVEFLVNAPDFCQFHEFRLAEKLVAVAVTDYLDDGLSAVYTFFDPDLSKRSLGQYAILWQIQQCQKLGFEYLYLGYWIKDCKKMSYKLQYRPIQLFINKKWCLLK